MNFFAIEMTRRRYASTISFTGSGLSRPRLRTIIMRMLYIGVSREDFLRNYQGSELDPHWLNRVSKVSARG